MLIEKYSSGKNSSLNAFRLKAIQLQVSVETRNLLNYNTATQERVQVYTLFFYIERTEAADKNRCLNPQVKSQATIVVSRQRWKQVRNYEEKNSLWSQGSPTKKKNTKPKPRQNKQKKNGVYQSSTAWMREGAWKGVGASPVCHLPSFLREPFMMTEDKGRRCWGSQTLNDHGPYIPTKKL